MLIQGAQAPGGAADVGLGKLQNYSFPSFNQNQPQTPQMPSMGLGGGIKPWSGGFQIPNIPSGSGDVFGGFTQGGAPIWSAGRDQNQFPVGMYNQKPSAPTSPAPAQQSMGSNVAGTAGGGMAPQAPQTPPAYTGATAQDYWKRTLPQPAQQPAQGLGQPQRSGPAGIGMFGNNPDGSEANARQGFINNLVNNPVQRPMGGMNVAEASRGSLAGNSIGVGMGLGVNPDAGRNVVGGTFQQGGGVASGRPTQVSPGVWRTPTRV